MSFFNNKSVNWIIIVLVVLNLGLLTFLIVQNQNRNNQFEVQELRKQRVSNFMHNSLNLSEQQRESFKKEGHVYFESMKEISLEIKNTKKKLYKEIFDNAPDKEKIDKLIDLIGTKHAELERLQFNHFNELKETCTPEQQEKLEAIMDEMIEMMENRQHKRKMQRGERMHRHRGH